MKNERILLIDDSEPANFLTRIILKDAGIDCEVEAALNGKQALELIARSQDCPDVILLDINMPVMDGHEFLKKFENRADCTHSTKVFMVTSSMREEDRESALKSPLVKGYFEKPLTRDNLREVKKCLTGTGGIF